MATRDRSMTVAPLQQVLVAVGQHLRRERSATAAQYAAWGTALVALLAALLHMLVRPLDTPWLLGALALPWIVAALQAVIVRPRSFECAEWADRHLGGHSAYATLVEVTAAPGNCVTPAAAHLEAWVAAATPKTLARLAALPRDHGLAKPLAAALVCVTLAATLLQLPTHPLGKRAREAAPDVADSALARSGPSRTADRRGATQPSATAKAEDPRHASGAVQALRKALAPAPDAAEIQADTADPRQTSAARSVDASARATAHVTATGREAGDSPDTATAAGITAPWQGQLTAQLRDLTAGGRAPLRADTGRAAEYAASTGTAADAAGEPVRVAPASPPPAAPTLQLGPAEQAYVRAYLADSGASP